MSSFPGGSKAVTLEKPSINRPYLVLVDSQRKVSAKESTEASFRKHHRGIGSIDSFLSSTTCVNTQSECSRPESRLSHEIRIEVEDTDGTPPLVSYHSAHEQTSKWVSLKDLTIYHGSQKAHTRRRVLLAAPSPVHSKSTESERSLSSDEQGWDEEARLVDEISSWVLRNTFGKDVDDCAAPLLIWDCTYRYLQELSSAVHEGKLGLVETPSGHGSPSSHGDGTPGPSSNDQQPAGQFGKGKRKAEGGSEDGSGLGGQDNPGDGDRDISPGSQAPSSKSTISNFSCPYRKRNPLRFNVRDYYVCATHSFADMSQLK
jgi:hypothetical protein